MKYEEYEKLTWKVVNKYGDRKLNGRLSLFVDTRSGIVYPVPRKIEHIDFINKVLDFKRNDYIFIIPTHIDIEMTQDNEFRRQVWRVVTGVSGLEISGGVKHNLESIYIAHKRTLDFISEGSVPSNIREENIVRRYVY